MTRMNVIGDLTRCMALVVRARSPKAITLLALATAGCTKGAEALFTREAGSDTFVSDLGVTDVADAADMTGTLVEASATDVADAGTVDSIDVPDIAPSGPVDLQGAWYAPAAIPDGGVADAGGTSSVWASRLRFTGSRYFRVLSDGTRYCAETGTFDASAGGIRFDATTVSGFPACPSPVSTTATVRGTGYGFELTVAGVGASYVRIRPVAKLFVTVERHNANLAGDATLAGANVIAKADSICANSLARPDDLPYRAVLVDGVNRSALPPADWVLDPEVTYFQSDGVLNVFRTNPASTVPVANHEVLLGPQIYVWTGLEFDFTTTVSTCNGWSSANTDINGGTARVGIPNAANTIFSSSIGVVCGTTAVAFLCVSQ